ncbi:LytR/AlgR family response regulator transcription factor [Emticicia fontis]
MKNKDLIKIGGYEKISPTNIMMLKADSNYTIIYLVDGKQILSSTNIGILEKRLKDFLFFRPNRSFVVNQSFISKFVDKTQTGSFAVIELKNKEQIRVSRRKVKGIDTGLFQNK